MLPDYPSPTIETLPPKLLVGYHQSMSVSDNKTGSIWRYFSPRIAEIKSRIGSHKLSLQIYPPHYFDRFNPTTTFEKWAAVEVSEASNLPDGLEQFVIPGGKYAVFHHRGSSADTQIFSHIFGKWIPQSGYAIDDRPHFEILGERYRNNDPNSEEDIWIPIK